MVEDDIDKRPWMRSQPSYGPAWDAAIEYGLDTSLIEQALSERSSRVQQTDELIRERLKGSTDRKP